MPHGIQTQRLITLPLVLAAALFVSPAVTAQADTADSGTSQRRFEHSHGLGNLEAIAKRMRFPKGFIEKNDPKASYAVEKESFFVHVPANYDGETKFGVLVWISPAPQGNCAPDWPEVYAKHKLIHIGPNNAGNNRFMWYRIALALDAVHNATSRYAIDPDRIYIAGHSGGGRLASTAAMLWPDVFCGGIYCCGTNHFRKIKKPGQEFFWPAKFQKPTGKRLGLAKRASRHVFINGETDFNLTHSRAVFTDLRKKHGFRRVSFFEMKGRGHTHPDGVWLSRCIEAMDGPLFAARKKAARRKRATGSKAPRR